jgi:hypothetical protein
MPTDSKCDLSKLISILCTSVESFLFRINAQKKLIFLVFSRDRVFCRHLKDELDDNLTRILIGILICFFDVRLTG